MNELAVRNVTLSNMDEIERAALAMSKSGYFLDAKDQAQAITKILAGREMGFGPFASMTGIYIISGRPSIGANLMAAAVKASGRYNYRVAEMTDAACEIIYFELGKECGRSRFTIEDARKAQTKNLDKFPRNMLFARAMSNGCRWYCPDVFLGAPTYTPEELGANVNEAGEVIDVIPTMTTPAARPDKITDLIPQPEPALMPSDVTAACAWMNSKGVRYGDLDTPTLQIMVNSMAKANEKPETTDEQRAERAEKTAAARLIMAWRAQNK